MSQVNYIEAILSYYATCVTLFSIEHINWILNLCTLHKTNLEFIFQNSPQFGIVKSFNKETNFEKDT